MLLNTLGDLSRLIEGAGYPINPNCYESFTVKVSRFRAGSPTRITDREGEYFPASRCVVEPDGSRGLIKLVGDFGLPLHAQRYEILAKRLFLFLEKCWLLVSRDEFWLGSVNLTIGTDNHDDVVLAGPVTLDDMIIMRRVDFCPENPNCGDYGYGATTDSQKAELLTRAGCFCFPRSKMFILCSDTFRDVDADKAIGISDAVTAFGLDPKSFYLRCEALSEPIQGKDLNWLSEARMIGSHSLIGDSNAVLLVMYEDDLDRGICNFIKRETMIPVFGIPVRWQRPLRRGFDVHYREKSAYGTHGDDYSDLFPLVDERQVIFDALCYLASTNPVIYATTKLIRESST